MINFKDKLSNFLNKKGVYMRNTESLNNNYKKRFEEYMKLIEGKEKEEKILFAEYLIKIIVEYLNYNELIKVVEDRKKELFYTKIDSIYESLNKCYKRREKIKIKDRDMEIYNNKFMDINCTPMLISPYHRGKFCSTFMNFIRGKRENYTAKAVDFSANYYIKPMNIVVCRNRYHTYSDFRVRNQSIVQVDVGINYSDLYKKIHFTGEDYIYDNKERISADLSRYVKNDMFFYSGVIFELSRVLLDKDKENVE